MKGRGIITDGTEESGFSVSTEMLLGVIFRGFSFLSWWVSASSAHREGCVMTEEDAGSRLSLEFNLQVNLRH